MSAIPLNDDFPPSKSPEWDISFVNTQKQIDYRHCQHLYWNLRSKLNPESEIEPATFVGLLSQTKRCDDIGTRLYHVREAYHDTMSQRAPLSYERVIRNECSDVDVEAAHLALQEHGVWTRYTLQNAMSFPNRLYFHCSHNAERAVTAVEFAYRAIFGRGRPHRNGPHLVKDIKTKWANSRKQSS